MWDKEISTQTSNKSSLSHPCLGIVGTPCRRCLHHLRSSGIEGKIEGMMAAEGLPKKDLDLGIRGSGGRIGMNICAVVVVSVEWEWARRLRSYFDARG
ncbi:hypothetical protein ACFX1R_010797 [Malus domestica]